jgi:hypothetical protein
MAANCRWTVVWRKSEERPAFRAGIPLGALSLGKLIPIFGVSIAIAGFGLSLVGVARHFLIVMTKVPTFRRPVKSKV